MQWKLSQVFALSLFATALYAQGFVDRWTFQRPNANNRMMMPNGVTHFAIPAGILGQGGVVVFDLKSIDNTPMDGVVFTPEGGAAVNLSGTTSQVVFPSLPRGRDASFTVKCSGMRYIIFNWNITASAPQASVAPPPPTPEPKKNDGLNIHAQVNTPVGNISATMQTENDRDDRGSKHRDKKDHRKDIQDDDDEFQKDGRFSTLDKANAESKVNLDRGKNYFQIPKHALKRDWNWKKVFLQISAEDNKPLDGMRVKSDRGRPEDLKGYSQQISIEDPGKGQNAIFFIKTPENRRIRINWWMAN